MEVISLVAAGTVATAGASGNSFDPLDFRTLTAQISVTAISGASATLTVFLDISNDGGTTWTQAAAGTGITATGSQLLSVGAGMASNAHNLGALIRARYTITGTTPSVTFGVIAALK